MRGSESEKWKSLSHVWLFATPWTIQSMEFSGQNTRVGSGLVAKLCPTLMTPWTVACLSLLRGIFPAQGRNPGFPHCRRILYQLSYKGSPRILEWVAYPFSGGSSQPRNWMQGSLALQVDFLPTELRPSYTLESVKEVTQIYYSHSSFPPTLSPLFHPQLSVSGTIQTLNNYSSVTVLASLSIF